jgi:NADH-quinone oxidoreductase subunit D
VLAIEKLLNIEVPMRAQYLRVLFAELTRICNHMLNMGAHAMDVGAMTPNLWMFDLREDCLNFFERASGARMHAAMVPPRRRPSGCAGKAAGRYRRLARQPLLPAVLDAMSLVIDNRIFKQRNVDIGIVSKEDAIALGLLRPDDPRRALRGICARASPTTSMTAWNSTFPVGTKRRLL